jgi:peptidoglycan hydrolase-like protein with peptidoglycan-binding domain
MMVKAATIDQAQKQKTPTRLAKPMPAPAGLEMGGLQGYGRESQLSPTAVIQAQHLHGNRFVIQRLLEPLNRSGHALNLAQRVAFDDIVGDPTAQPNPGTTIHPTVRQGSSGPAVEELQQKLNADGAAPVLVADGIFGPLTRAAVVAFQQKYGLGADGIVGPLTWGKIDELGLASDVGRVERQWEEEVGGQIYGMTSRYTWRILDDEVRITVKLRFTGVNNPAAIATSFDNIHRIWNHFKAVNTTTGQEYRIVFEAQQVNGGEDNAVRLLNGNGRSDAGNWYIGDPDLGQTAAHEFGHMIGLEDEYQRAHTDYQRLVGEAPGVGQQAGPGSAPPADVAAELFNALREPVDADKVNAANQVIANRGLQQGEYAQQIAAAYQAANGISLVQDIVDRIPNDDEWGIVDPFTHSSGSLMGMGTNHAHPVEPRHVREFVGYLRASRPGVYNVEPV